MKSTNTYGWTVMLAAMLVTLTVARVAIAQQHGSNASPDFNGISSSFSTGSGVAVASNASSMSEEVVLTPSSGKGGSKVTITANHLSSATGVTFNGTAATFEVVSARKIITKVPAGATSGTVVVTLAGGKTLSSTVPFTVIP